MNGSLALVRAYICSVRLSCFSLFSLRRQTIELVQMFSSIQHGVIGTYLQYFLLKRKKMGKSQRVDVD